MKTIFLTKNRMAVVDDCDYELVNSHNWCWMKSRDAIGYAARRNLGKTQLMHRFILGEDCGIVDHINHNTLDNRRSNLRSVSGSQNSMNTSIRANKKFKGVSYVSRGNKRWRAYISFKGKQVCLGMHNTELEAAIAYDKKAIELYGEYARTNSMCRDMVPQEL